MKPVSILITTVMVAFLVMNGTVQNSIAQTADVQTATAEGLSAIVDNNIAAARDGAINDALRKAVEQAVGTMVSAETVAENFTVLSDRIYSKTSGYVRKYDVLSEAPEGQLYRVTVRAEVAAGEIKDDLSALGLLLSRKNMPRVMIMVAEQNIGQEHFVYWWGQAAGREVLASSADLTITENTLLKELSGKGFNVVDHAVTTTGRVTLPPAYKVDSLSNTAVKEIGSLYGAEVVIYGQAVAKLKGSILGTSMLSSMANTSLRAVQTDNGQVIASGSANAAGAHPDEITAGSKALAQAAQTLAEDLLGQIMNRWNSDVSGGTLTQINISGLVTYDHLMAFKDTLRASVRGVKQIYQRTFDAQSALLEVEYTGPAHELADAIARTRFPGFSAGVTGVTQNGVSVTLSN